MKKQSIKLIVRLLFSAMFLSVQTENVIAQPGTLDSSFGINGKVVTESFGKIIFCTEIQSDGKIVVGGESMLETIKLARYKSDGHFDSTFGDNGIVTTDLVPVYQLYYSAARDISIQPDGKIITVSQGYKKSGIYGEYDIALVRYNTNGTLDESFGDNGIVVNDFGSDYDDAECIILQPDGKILIGGQSINTFVARYNADGTLDKTFNGIGWAKYNSGYIGDIVVQPDSKLVFGGKNTGSFPDKFMVIRVKPDGKKDSSFGTYGVVITDFAPGGGDEAIYSIALQPDGKIIAAGGTAYDDGDIAIARYETTGALDTSFGDEGKVRTKVSSNHSYARKVLLQDGKIIVGGWSKDFLIARYNKDGSLNDNFGDSGITVTDFGLSTGIVDAAIQQDGKIIGVGYRSYSALLARYEGDRETTPRFARIKKWLHKHGFTWDDFPHLALGGSIHVERSSNGNIFTTIASIAAHNNNQPYNFEDPAPLAGINYYRLTATAADGSNVSSNVIAIGSSDAAAVKIFPNPVKNSLQVTGLSATQKTILSITDLSGAARKLVTVTGSSYTWNIGHLKAGSYILRIENGDVVVSKMFVKE